MSSSVNRVKSTRTSSLASFYNYGPALSEAPPPRRAGGASMVSGRISDSSSTPRSLGGTPGGGAGPSRNPRRRPSQQQRPFEDTRGEASAHPTPQSLPIFSPVPLVIEKPSKSPYVNNGTVLNLQQVRFNSSPEVIEASPQSEDGGTPLGVDPEIWRAFLAADTDRSGYIDPGELRTALVNSPWNKPFEDATIDMLINIFDLNKNKAIEITEFVGLSNYVKAWRMEFEKSDKDKSGTIDAKELKKALARFGYNLPLRVVKMLHHKHASQSHAQYDEESITFDQFIRACVAVENMGKTFEQFNGPRSQRDKSHFENFVLVAVSG